MYGKPYWYFPLYPKLSHAQTLVTRCTHKVYPECTPLNYLQILLKSYDLSIV